MRHIWQQLRMPLAALFVLALVAAGCGDDAAEPVVDTAAVNAAQAEADAAQAEADAARAEAESAAEAAAEAEEALAEAEAAAAAASAEQQAEAQAALDAAQAEAAAAQEAATAAESRADEAETAAGEASAALAEATAEPEEEVAAPTGDPGRVTIAISEEPSTLDPQLVNDRNSRVVTSNLFESLLARDSSMALVPGLATSYEVIDDDTWRFEVREGVTFHDGQALNAQAVADSLNRMLDQDYKELTQRDSYIDNIVSAEVVGDYTVDIHTDGINAILPLQIAQLPVIAPGTGDTVAEDPVGTGPYMLEAWDRGQLITAVSNPNYWGEAPSIDAFSVRFIDDKQTALAALQAGEVDLVLDILPEQVSLVPQPLSVAAPEFSYITINAFREELSSPEVRIAMNLAVNKEEIAETLYEGYARPNNAQHLAPGNLGFNPDIGPFPYDPERAAQMIIDAGYPDGFRVTLYAPFHRYLRGVETARAVADSLTKIGLDARVELAEWTTFRAGSRIKGDQPGAYDLRYGWNSNEWFDGARTRSHVTCPDRRGTSSKLCDEEVTDLFLAALDTLDQAERDRLYQEAWALLNENPHAIYLLQQDLIYGASERLVWDPRLDDEYLVAEMSLG